MHRISLLLTFTLSASWVSPCTGQESASPTTSGGVTAVSESAEIQVQEAAGHHDQVARLEAYIEKALEDWQVPGLAVAIVKDDEVLMSRGFGVSKVGTEEKVNGDTLFAIASNTKAYTSAALAILVDEGKLSWDDHVSDFLPWLQLKDPMTRDLRVRDLLCHRSGLGTFSGDLLWWGTSYTPREVLERAVVLEPASNFRAQYGYSNLMFLAAGLVIEQVSETPWQQFIADQILTPLEMTRTVTSVTQLDEKGNFATPHKTFLDSSKPIPWMNWDTMAAAGGIISSTNDMSKWLRLQLRRGELGVMDEASGESNVAKRLFSSKQSRTMWQAHMPIPVSESYRKKYPSTHFRAYGLGWGLSDYLSRKVVAHGGGYDGMYSQVVLVPEENLGVVVLTNSMTSITSAITYKVLDSFLGGEERNWSKEKLAEFRKSRKEFHDRIEQSITPVSEGTTPSHSIDAYTGKFKSELYGNAVVEIGKDNQLVLKLLPNADLVADLTHLHYDTFAIKWRKDFAWFGAGTAHFVSDSRGNFVKIELDVPNDDLWFYELDLHRAD